LGRRGASGQAVASVWLGASPLIDETIIDEIIVYETIIDAFIIDVFFVQLYQHMISPPQNRCAY
jgi:hypothetical protein